MADRKQGGAEDYARRRQYDYRAVSLETCKPEHCAHAIRLHSQLHCASHAANAPVHKLLCHRHLHATLNTASSQNSNLVLTAETRTRDATEPSGEPESLHGRFGKTKMGDRVQYTKPEGLDTKKAATKKKCACMQLCSRACMTTGSDGLHARVHTRLMWLARATQALNAWPHAGRMQRSLMTLTGRPRRRAG